MYNKASILFTYTPMQACPCNSQKNYLSCCEPYITGKQKPLTPETLMRSRYTAYTMANIDYIKATMRAAALVNFQEAEAKLWAQRIIWINLKVFEEILETTNLGYVEFEASFIEGERLKFIHEKSRFIKDDDSWYYVSGIHLPPTHKETLISRNTSCPCKSQRKFKNCHGKRLSA